MGQTEDKRGLLCSPARRLVCHAVLFFPSLPDRWICKTCGECDSCGQHTPGRRGTSWVHKVGQGRERSAAARVPSAVLALRIPLYRS